MMGEGGGGLLHWEMPQTRPLCANQSKCMTGIEFCSVSGKKELLLSTPRQFVVADIIQWVELWGIGELQREISAHHDPLFSSIWWFKDKVCRFVEINYLIPRPWSHIRVKLSPKSPTQENFHKMESRVCIAVTWSTWGFILEGYHIGLVIAASCNFHYRPIYIGKNLNPKKLGFLLYCLHCQKNP